MSFQLGQHGLIVGFATIAMGGLCASSQAAITFLHHFNSDQQPIYSPAVDTSSLNVNTANGDYSAGSGTATVSGQPGLGAGFFTGSSPANGALYNTGDPNFVNFSSADNFKTTSPTTGGVTVGMWVKFSGAVQGGRIMYLGPSNFATDYFLIDFGGSAVNTLRARYGDIGIPGPAANNYSLTKAIAGGMSDWTYIAVTVELDAQAGATPGRLTLYTYDKNGVATNGANGTFVNVPVAGWNPAQTAQFSLGDLYAGGTFSTDQTISIDEFSIDNTALTAAEIQARVSSMVNGNELAIPEPASLGLLSAAGLLLARRRKM